MTRLDDVRAELVQLWGALGPFWGIAPMTARVYAHLLGQAAPQDGGAIATDLGISRGGVSLACRELVDWGLLHMERPPGERRVLYRVEEDPERVVRGIVATRKRREWDPILDRVRTWKRELRRDRSRAARVLSQRLDEIEALVGFVDRTADAFLAGGLIPRLGLKTLVRAARRSSQRRRSSA